MARVGRYCFCPAAGKISRRNHPTFRNRLLRLLRKNQNTVLVIGNYGPAYYPAKK